MFTHALNKVPDYLSVATHMKSVRDLPDAFLKDVWHLFNTVIMKPLCFGIENDLRLETLSHLGVHSRDPLLVG